MGRPVKEIRTNLTEDEREFVTLLVDRLPPVIARADVEKYFGGVVSPFTVRNADQEGKGPDVAWRVGKKVVYNTESLVRWIVWKLGVSRIQNATTL